MSSPFQAAAVGATGGAPRRGCRLPFSSTLTQVCRTNSWYEPKQMTEVIAIPIAIFTNAGLGIDLGDDGISTQAHRRFLGKDNY